MSALGGFKPRTLVLNLYPGRSTCNFEYRVRTLSDLGQPTSESFIFTFRQAAKNIVKTSIFYHGLATFWVNPVEEYFLGPCPRTLMLIFGLATPALRKSSEVSNPGVIFYTLGPKSRTLVQNGKPGWQATAQSLEPCAQNASRSLEPCAQNAS